MAAKKIVEEPTSLWNLEKDGVTQSMLHNFLACKEKFRLSYVEGWKPSKLGSQPMEFGTCIHDILDMIYTASKEVSPEDFLECLDVVIKNACDIYESEKHEDLTTDGNDWKTLAENVSIAEVLLPEYFKFWNKDWFLVNWVALEEVFDVPIEVDGKTIRIRGKLDGVQKIGKKLWLFETKTKGRIDEAAIADKLSIDLQVNLYLWAIWKVYGAFPAGVVYNLIRRPMLRQKVNETLGEFASRIKKDVKERPDFYFIRTQGAVAKTEILEWEQKEFIPILKELIRWNDGHGHFKNVSYCFTAFAPCQFLRICGQNSYASYNRKNVLFEELAPKPVKKIMVPRGSF